MNERELRLRSRIDALLDEREKLQWHYLDEIADLEHVISVLTSEMKKISGRSLLKEHERAERWRKRALDAERQLRAMASTTDRERAERWKERALAAEWRVKILEGKRPKLRR